MGVPLTISLKGLVVLAAFGLGDLVVTGKVVYGRAQGAKTAATVDILKVYASNPTYMYLRQRGLSESRGEGAELFKQAQKATNRALAREAKEARVDVITVPGGVSGGNEPIRDLTAKVIDHLPLYHVHGKVLHGRTANARAIGVLSSHAVLNAIPEYRQWKTLGPDDAEFHFLYRTYTKVFEDAVARAAKESNVDAVVERGGVTSRKGPPANLTAAAIRALAR